MKLIRTIKLKLDIPVEVIKPTFDAYTKAFNLVCQIGWNDSDSNGVSLHNKTYFSTRKYLPSQLAVSARMKATEAIKAVKARLKKKQKATCPQSKQCSVRYDARSFNVWFERNELSLLTIEGRIKIPVSVPEYFQQYLTWKRCSADLFIRKNKVFLNIVFSKDIADPEVTGKVVGIDRGIKKIAVTSENQFFDGGQSKRVSKHYEKIRKALQSCGSKSAKRHLRKISKKENRFRTDANHVVTKRIVESFNPGTVIALEKLTGIKQSTRLRKKQRKDLNKWNFFQFEQFLTYKAKARGITVEYVDARYTSQKCSVCGYISRSNRQSQAIFKCKHCGFSLNADLNASRNIRQNYLDATCYPSRASVNRPIVAHDDVKAPLQGIATECSYKPPALAGG
ncbi:IS200/IS605 family element transposase accessory protein TnpB, partial [Candidatus Pacearchaeota archaeon]|nr:IS200/IS605 family element transposase accessory protein TnpB [Candidatus Pacearchaeota archaeon]